MLWETAHGVDYAIPNEILMLVGNGEAHDLSWKNDMCPQFGRVQIHTDEAICIWVEHPDVDKREMGIKRFMVARYEDSSSIPHDWIITDNVDEAIAHYRTLISRQKERAA